MQRPTLSARAVPTPAVRLMRHVLLGFVVLAALLVALVGRNAPVAPHVPPAQPAGLVSLHDNAPADALPLR
jgi:hypothetical protein